MFNTNLICKKGIDKKKNSLEMKNKVGMLPQKGRKQGGDQRDAY